MRQPEEFKPGMPRGGWQHEAASRVEQHYRDADLFPRLNAPGEALVRSQAGPGAGLALSTCPTCRITSLEPQLFRVLLLRRWHLHLPLSSRFCRCGQPLDPCGLRRAACARVGVLGRRGYSLESVAARICREAGARVTTNILVRDLDLAEPNATDGPLPLFGGAQLAIDTTLVSTLHANGLPRRAGVDGAALQAARRRKERRYPELARRFGRARLVVLAVEVCGRWSKETQSFLSSLAHAKARSETSLMRRRVEQAWRLRWGSLFSCTVARAVATSLLELPGARGADGDCPPSCEVERDFRHAGLSL